jgi:ATP-binding cassette subfamily B protein
VVDADEILVLDKGTIVERGNHQSLLDAGGVYAAMWNRQREVDEAQEKLRRAAEEEPAPVKVGIGRDSALRSQEQEEELLPR